MVALFYFWAKLSPGQNGAFAMIKPALVPAEWATQQDIWIGWPSDTENWPDDLDGARGEVAAFAKACSARMAVHLVAGNARAAANAGEHCAGFARIHHLPMGDIWLRDTGPIFVSDGAELTGLTFGFNGWGGRYVLDGDTQTADAILGVTGHKARRSDFTLEGGSLDHNGAGTLLTTRQCLLNENRNSGWTEEIAEAHLKAAFGADRVVWLGDGLEGDHTDGHVDNIARFIGPSRVVCQHPSGEDDPNADTYARIAAGLKAAGFEVVTIPSPGKVLDRAGEVAAASHVNFVFANGAIIMPIYNETYGDAAQRALQDAMPEYEIIGLPSKHILSGGGSFHCISQQVPAVQERRAR